MLELLRPWTAQCTEALVRYKFFILHGGPQSGKRTHAKNWHRIFGWKPPCVQLVQDAAAADLQDLKGDQHGLIIFDNIDAISFVMSHGPAWSLSHPSRILVEKLFLGNHCDFQQ